MSDSAALDAVRCSEALSEAFRARGFNPQRTDGTTFMVTALAMGFSVVETQRLANDAGVGVAIIAHPIHSPAPGIQLTAVGINHDLDAAAAEAAEQCAAHALAVIVSYLQPNEPNSDVTKNHMIVRTTDSNECFGWTVLLGPVISRAFLKASSPEPEIGPSIQKPIFGRYST